MRLTERNEPNTTTCQMKGRGGEEEGVNNNVIIQMVGGHVLGRALTPKTCMGGRLTKGGEQDRQEEEQEDGMENTRLFGIDE